MDTTPKVATTADCWGDLTILNALADVRGEIKDAEGSVKDAILESNSQRQVAELNLHNRLCEAEKAAIQANYESRIAVKDSEARIMARLEECCCDNEKGILELRNHVDNKFSGLERRALQEEIDELREEKADGVNDGILSTLNAILLKIK